MRLICFLLISMLFTGCGGDNAQDLREFVKNSGENMRGQIAPPPEVKLYQPFAYMNEEDLSNPFQPRKKSSRGGGRAGFNQPDLDRPREALEEFALEALKVVGYLYRDSVGYAVIRAPDSKLHRVQVGNYVGLNFGLIEEVTGNEVVIREVVQDSVGDWSERMSGLQLLEN
jgi:type IV pilus assembly protein PilP